MKFRPFYNSIRHIITIAIFLFLTGAFSDCEEDVNAPSNLTVVFISPSEVRLTWNDNSHNETAFYVFLKTLPQDKHFVFIGIVDKNITSFIDKGLIKDTHYIYKVCSETTGYIDPVDGTCSNEVEVIGL